MDEKGSLVSEQEAPEPLTVTERKTKSSPAADTEDVNASRSLLKSLKLR